MSRVGEDTNNAAKGRDFGDCVIGEIQLTAGNITAGGMPANGQELAISQYDAALHTDRRHLRRQRRHDVRAPGPPRPGAGPHDLFDLHEGIYPSRD